MSSIQAVIFDMDGVIVDSEPLNDGHMTKFLHSLGVTPDFSKLDHRGLNSKAVWEYYLTQYDLPYTLENLISKARLSYVDYLKRLNEIPVIDGAIQLIKDLAEAGYILGLASSANPKRIDLFLDKLSLRSYFSAIVHGDDVSRSKPDPEVFIIISQRLDLLPQQCVVIEDSPNGVAAAKAANMYCIALLNHYTSKANLNKADLIVKSLIELNSDKIQQIAI